MLDIYLGTSNIKVNELIYLISFVFILSFDALLLENHLSTTNHRTIIVCFSNA